jgi:F-type H+-transporting ATPase subunit b
LTAIDAREKDISSRRAVAVAEQAQAIKEQEECIRQKEGLEQERRAMLKVVQDETKNERSRILQEATRDAEHLRVAREMELEETTVNYQDELIRLTRREIISIVRKILTDLASAELENSAFDLFDEELFDVISGFEAFSPPGRSHP